jgi:hypothetical protein
VSFNLDEFLSDGDGGEYVVDVPIRHRHLAQKHDELEHLIAQRLQSASDSLGGDAEVRAMADALEELERRIDAEAVVYKFRGLSRRRWRDLMAKHPPKPAHAGHDFNPETFPVAAIAACSVDPKLSIEDARALEDDETLGTGNFERLWEGVLTANLGVLNDTPKSLIATLIPRMNGDSLTTAAPGESPGASS